MAAQGYPGAYEKGSVIRGLDLAGGNSDDVKIFHAGTKKGPGGEILASGGRVLDVTAMASTIEHAQALAYADVDTLDWPARFCRRDIGWRALTHGCGATSQQLGAVRRQGAGCEGHRRSYVARFNAGIPDDLLPRPP